jgi:molybdopterin-guanine dinucleotide biosynthesis protein A
MGNTSTVTAPASAVVLAGGESRRLGQDKSLLILDGQPLLVRTLDRLAAVSDDLIVVTNTPQRYQHLHLAARLVRDERPGVGSLMGIYSGLKAARHDRALVVACDMPFLSLPLLRHLLTRDPACDVVIPRLGDWPEPLHAVYDKACLPAIERVLARGRRQIVAFFDQVCLCEVTAAEIDRLDPRHLSFVNVNTIEDWARVQALAAKANA